MAGLVVPAIAPHEKSDPAIVAVKPANKAERSAAERVIESLNPASAAVELNVMERDGLPASAMSSTLENFGRIAGVRHVQPETSISNVRWWAGEP
jgi:hypothetical protein